MTKVVFRAWTNGDILALFPELPATNDGYTCQSYEHVGQHGAADYHGCLHQTRPATDAEYAELKAELERIGYVLDVVKRVSYHVHQWRAAQCR
jgi:hypothetical protein